MAINLTARCLLSGWKPVALSQKGRLFENDFEALPTCTKIHSNVFGCSNTARRAAVLRPSYSIWTCPVSLTRVDTLSKQRAQLTGELIKSSAKLSNRKYQLCQHWMPIAKLILWNFGIWTQQALLSEGLAACERMSHRICSILKWKNVQHESSVSVSNKSL